MSQVAPDDLKKWEQLVLAPILQGRIPSLEDVERLGGLSLLSADSDKIREYVFESARLPEIRGASMILDGLNQGWAEDDGPNVRKLFSGKGLPAGHKDDPDALSCIIYAGGGSLLALVPGNLAEALKTDIEALYPQETGTATITCVVKPVAAEDVQKRFADLMARQSLNLRRAKEGKDPLPFFEAIPPVRRCQSCQIRPASVRQDAPDERWLCWPCHRKVERSREQGGKKQWTRSFVGELLAGRLDCARDRYLGGFDPTALDSVYGATDLSEIAQASRDKKTIALIYADGNDIGRLVEGSSTIGEYRGKSDALQQAMRQAVFTALGHHLKIVRCVPLDTVDGKARLGIHPFEIITVGGDDALLIVPGDRALDVAVQMGSVFEEKMAQSKAFAGQRTTLSVGLVVADHQNPVYFLRALAEELLKSAKRRNRELADAGQSPAEGTLDFLVLKSQAMLSTDLGDLRAHFPWTIISSAPRREKAILTGRPYTWTEVERLKRTAQAVGRGLPRTQLQAMRRALREGRLTSTLFYLYQWARADEWRKVLLRWVEIEWGVQAPNTPPPWAKMQPEAGYDRYWTVWEDIHEVLDLVPRLDDATWRTLKGQVEQKMERGEVPHAG